MYDHIGLKVKDVDVVRRQLAHDRAQVRAKVQPGDRRAAPDPRDADGAVGLFHGGGRAVAHPGEVAA